MTDAASPKTGIDSLTENQISLARISEGWRRLSTLLGHAGRKKPPAEGCFVNSPVARGSTVLFPTVKHMNHGDNRSHEHQLVYGAMGNPVQHELEHVLALVEGGTDTQVTSSGLSACTVALLAFLEQGAHLLLPDSVYGPTRRFANTVLARFGVEVSFYPPCADEAGLRCLIRPNTSVIYAESPGSHSFEVQDIPLLARIAHEASAKLVMDNTWGIGIFKPFQHGVDVSVQALTKYPCGHSDVIAGAITTNNQADWKRLRDTAIQLGETAGPDECWLVLRGLRSMSVRLERQSQTAYQLACWLKTRPEVAYVRHPALPDCPGHTLWQRDFTGASSLFGVELKPEFTLEESERMIDSLEFFGIGGSWGGYESLVLPTCVTRHYKDDLPKGPAFRLHVGLEEIEDLKADLEHGLIQLSAR